MNRKFDNTVYSLGKFTEAVQRFNEALKEKDSLLSVDGSIQRFEFTFELSWKTLKRYLEYEGIVVTTPRECLKSGFRLGLIDDEEQWLDMLDDRNRMAHIYSETEAEAIYMKLPGYLEIFQCLLSELKNRLK